MGEEYILVRGINDIREVCAYQMFCKVEKLSFKGT